MTTRNRYILSLPVWALLLAGARPALSQSHYSGAVAAIKGGQLTVVHGAGSARFVVPAELLAETRISLGSVVTVLFEQRNGVKVATGILTPRAGTNSELSHTVCGPFCVAWNPVNGECSGYAVTCMDFPDVDSITGLNNNGPIQPPSGRPGLPPDPDVSVNIQVTPRQYTGGCPVNAQIFVTFTGLEAGHLTYGVSAGGQSIGSGQFQLGVDQHRTQTLNWYVPQTFYGRVIVTTKFRPAGSPTLFQGHINSNVQIVCR
jgi:hypothetical protein